MTFSSEFLTLLVYGSLAWCAISATALSAMLLKDLLREESW